MKLTSDFITNLADFFVHQEETRLIWPPVFLGIGAALYFSLSFEPSFVQTGVILGASACLFAMILRFYHRRSESESRYLLYLLFFGAFITVIGFSLAQARSYWVGTPMIMKETRPVRIIATLDHLEDKEGGKGHQVILKDIVIEKWDEGKVPKMIRLTVRTKIEEDIRVGDKIAVLAKLTPPARPVMVGSFDYARHFYFESVGGLGFSLSSMTLVEKKHDYFVSLTSLRQAVSANIKEHVTGASRGIVVALMTGERAAIAESDWQALRASGLAHIISISGLHVAMVAAPVFFLIRFILAMIPFIALRWDIKKIAALSALIVCSLYVGFVVPSVPTTRALLMTGVALVAIMLDRSPFSLRLVGFSALLILLFSPESIWSASFQMSFSAVTALVLIANWMAPYWAEFRRESGWFKKSILYLSAAILTSFVASIATAPFVWYHFQQFASYSVLGNFLAMPLSGLIIMPMMLVAYFVMPFGLAAYPLKMMSQGVDWLLDVARFVQSLPMALVTGTQTPSLFLYMMIIGGGCIVLCAPRFKIVSVAFFAIGFVAVVFFPRPDILLSDSGQTMMIRQGDQSYFSSKRKDRFIREQWVTRLGIEDQLSFPREGVEKLQNGFISCDSSACRIEMNGIRVSYSSSYDALEKDCAWADYLVSPKWIDYSLCPTAKIMDLKFFKREGAVSIFVKEDAVSVRTVHDDIGYRPWAR